MIQTAERLDLVFTHEKLYSAWVYIASKHACPGIDGISIDDFAVYCNSRIGTLCNTILNGSYTPHPVVVFPKEKKDHRFREIVIPTVSDKIVAKTAADFEMRKLNSGFAPQSYAYRPGKSALKAVKAVENAVRNKKTSHVIRIDIKNFFDSINHQLLENMLKEYNHSEEIINLLMIFAKNARFDGVRLIHPPSGVPQGSPLAPVLSNLYLDYFDKQLNRREIPFIRYADDIILFAQDINEAGEYMNFAISVLNSLSLDISVDKTRIYPVDKGFVFLGFFFTRDSKMPCQEACDRLSEKLASPQYDDESDEEYLKRLESKRRGWNNYFHFDSPETSAPYPDLSGKENMISDCDVETHSEELNQDSENSDENNEGEKELIKDDAATADKEKYNSEDDNERLQTLLAELDALYAAGESDKIIRKLRSLLSGEIELEKAMFNKLNRQLAEQYETKGLHGAAEKCRKIAGDKTEQNNYRSKDSLVYGTENVNNWLDIFFSDSHVYRQYIDRVGRNGYKPASKQLNATYLMDHWQGRHTLSIPLFDKQNNVRFALLDLDISRARIEHCSSKEVDQLKEALFNDALGILDTATKHGVTGIIEDSGYKGYHVWFFFFKRIPAKFAKDFLQALDRVAGPPPEGTHRELFPASEKLSPDKLNSRIKMPLGMHRLTGRYSKFINRDGSEATNGILLLSSHSIFNKTAAIKHATASMNEYTTSDALQENIKQKNDRLSSPEEPSDIEKLFDSCAVLRAIRDKAEKTGRLSHYERVVLRGVLAPMKEEGKMAIHSILSKCENYSRSLTDKMLAGDRTQPMGCRRIGEILSYMTQKVGCNCKFRKTKNDYPHPLRHLKRKSQSKRTTEGKVEHSSPEEEPAGCSLHKAAMTIDTTNAPYSESAPETKHSSVPETGKQRRADDDDIFSLSIKIGPIRFNMNLNMGGK